MGRHTKIKTSCNVENCDQFAKCKGLCMNHYNNLHRRGDPLAEPIVKKAKDINGLSASGEYYSWRGMIKRCYNSKTPGYKNYGGAGVVVCDRWKNSFQSFLDDMGKRPAGHSIDRIDVYGNYEPSNCRWADTTTQAINKRMMSRNTSGYVGVSKTKYGKRWMASICLHYKHTNLGCYDTPEEASEVYQKACAKRREAVANA